MVGRSRSKRTSRSRPRSKLRWMNMANSRPKSKRDAKKIDRSAIIKAKITMPRETSAVTLTRRPSRRTKIIEAINLRVQVVGPTRNVTRLPETLTNKELNKLNCSRSLPKILEKICTSYSTSLSRKPRSMRAKIWAGTLIFQTCSKEVC